MNKIDWAVSGMFIIIVITVIFTLITGHWYENLISAILFSIGVYCMKKAQSI